MYGSAGPASAGRPQFRIAAAFVLTLNRHHPLLLIFCLVPLLTPSFRLIRFLYASSNSVIAPNANSDAPKGQAASDRTLETFIVRSSYWGFSKAESCSTLRGDFGVGVCVITEVRPALFPMFLFLSSSVPSRGFAEQHGSTRLLVVSPTGGVRIFAGSSTSSLRPGDAASPTFRALSAAIL